MIAALFVAEDGLYADKKGIDAWHASRDARRYAGPWPVIAHPPCARWCLFAAQVEHNHGIRIGADGGCFASALKAVHLWGGVLEHPAYTRAYAWHGIRRPEPGAGWQDCETGGSVCHIEQGNYGHDGRKKTWLYVYGARSLPVLNWRASTKKAVVGHSPNAPSLSKRACYTTPPEFKRILLAIASQCTGDLSPHPPTLAAKTVTA